MKALSVLRFKDKTTICARILICLLLSNTACHVSAATNMTPIAVTGWNLDVMIEDTAVGPPFTSVASEVSPGDGCGFYQTGLTGYVWGLPPSGAFVSQTGDNTLFQFQPYTAKNALVLSSDTGLTSGTLTLESPATYASLAILAHSASDTNQTAPVTLNFEDGTSYTTTYYAADWVTGSANMAWFGNGRVNLTTGTDTGGTQSPRYFETVINVAALLGATNKPLASITFAKTASASTAIYAVSGLLGSGVAPAAEPISVTGFNRDLVVENTSSGPPYATAGELNPGEGNAFYQSGLSGKSYGLPASGAFKSVIDGSQFQFQPYTASNSLVLSSETGLTNGTLTLTSPAVYNSICVIANSANATSTSVGSLSLNFADGTSLVSSYHAFDWFSNPGYALQQVERISLSSGATQGASTGDPRFYQTTLDIVALVGATNKPLASVTFGKPSGVGATGIYALSGVRGNQAGGTYTLPTVTNTFVSGLLNRAATMGGDVVSSGGTAPEVFIYYGTSDAGTNATNWAQRIYFGPLTGSFSQTVTGLAPNTTYYYRSAAINPAGVAWAASSQSVTTAPVSLAVVTNLPASNITTQAAVLSGNILSTGGDAPVVTIYYGPSNGGTNSNAWAHSLALPGTQRGTFAQAASGLGTNTTHYYYSAAAVNAAGTAWGAPVQSFSTLTASPPVSTLVSVLTGRNDNGRTGQNTNETMLTPANVNTNTFGLVFSCPLDGCMVAQPLILPNVSIPGNGVHNLVFAATEHDSVYAFDADSNAGPNSAPLWHVSFINPAAGITPLQCAIDLQASSSPGFYGPEVGISGTPVIDQATGTIYVAAKTKEITSNATNFVYRLHALDVTSGAEKFGGPIVIQGSLPGLGDDEGFPGIVNFDVYKHMNRPALLLNNGILTVTFTSHQDFPPYHGWVFTYNAYTLQETGVFNTTLNGSGGGIWQAAVGPAADAAGNIYFETGNGTFDAFNENYGDSVVKLSTSGGLALVDYFTPYNQLSLNLSDLDIGSAGLMLLPDAAGNAAHPHLLIAGSKTGVFWLLDRDNLGQFNASGDTQIVQEISGATKGMWVTPAYFNGTIYYCASGDNAKAFAISNAVISTTPTSQSTATISYPGSSLCVSANGTSNAIVWGLDTSGNQNRPAILHAYNATNLAQELYNSSLLASRDSAGLAIKYTMPTIANGKVYVGTANLLSVYGNISFLATPIISPAGGMFTNSVLVSITSPSNDVSIHYTLDGSTPTTNSMLYTNTFMVSNNTIVLAVTVFPGQPNSGVASASFVNSASLGNGTGLLGQYYANTLYTAPFVGTPLVRTDPAINFNWNTNSPDPSIPLTNYTVRWTGMVQPFFSQAYTFWTTTDDGVRLYVNGQELVNEWTPQSPTAWSGSIALRAFQLYPIEMDYFQAGGGAIAQLAWSSPATTETIIPQTQLYPFTNSIPILFTATPAITNGQLYLQLSVMPGYNYVLQGSTNLVNWVSLSTNVPSTTVMKLADSAATNFPSRFYRVVQLP